MGHILCLDLGRNLGIVYNIKKITGDSVIYKTVKLGKSGDFGSGLSHFQKILDERVDNHIEGIHYEKVQRHIGTLAAHAYGAYQGLVLKTAYECKIPVYAWPVGVIKKSFTGNGRASKEDMIQEALRRGYKDVKDDNSADALAIYHLAIDKASS